MAGPPGRRRGMEAGGGWGGELRGFEGELWAPGDAGFSGALRAAAAANAAVDGRRPTLLARPRGVSDVRRCVRAAQARARRGGFPAGASPLCVRGGGHSELCLLDGALAVDLSWGLSWVECDPGSCLVRCGGGATLKELQEVAGEHGLACPVGLHDTVGVGLLLQGGVGRLSRRHGLAVDNVLGVQIVTASGEVVALGDGFSVGPGASSEGPRASQLRDDLWWCARGAGPNFGIVTAVALRVFPVGPVLHGRIPWRMPRGDPIEVAAAALTRFEEAARRLPRDQQVDCILGMGAERRPVGAFFPFSLEGRPFAESAVRAMGLPRGGAEAPDDLALEKGPFQSVPYPNLEGITSQDADSAQIVRRADSRGAGAGAVAQTRVLAYVRQCFVDRLGADGWRAILRAVSSAPSDMAEVMLQHAGGKVRARNATDLAFAPRRWEFSVVVVASWTEPSSLARRENEAWADAAFDSLRPFATGLYAADIDPVRRPAAAAGEVQQAFQENLPRLLELKRRHDPDGLFRGTCPLVPLPADRPRL